MERRITARGIIVKNDKLLCLRLKPYEGHKNDYWCVPGGGIDPGEPLVASVEREIIEELGVQPKVGNLLFIQQFGSAETGRENLDFFFHITNSDDFLDIDLSKTSHGDKEIETIEFVDPITNDVRPKFLCNENLKNLGSLPTKIFNYL